MRNGPWAPDDVVICAVRIVRLPLRAPVPAAAWCLEDVSVAEVSAAVQQRLGHSGRRRAAMSELARRIARYRVRLGFPSAALALWLAQPTERSLAAGAIVAVVGEGCASGRRGISRKGAR